ncbi:MAG: helix-turn-helix domain-containing protein [Solirubrobacterales bacterium]
MKAASNSEAGDLFLALSHPLRRRILRAMIKDEAEISPRDLSLGLGEPLSRLSYHVRILAWCDAIELVRTEQVRGSMQHFYRLIVDERWARMALEATGDPPEKAKP